MVLVLFFNHVNACVSMTYCKSFGEEEHGDKKMLNYVFQMHIVYRHGSLIYIYFKEQNN